MRNKTIIIVLIVIVSILIVTLGAAIVYVVMQRNQDEKNTTKVMNSIANDASNQISNESENNENTLPSYLNDVEQQTFNTMFESYEGDNVSASTVRGLFAVIESSNQTNTEHIINLANTGITDLSQIDTNKKYKVQLFKDTQGFVNNIEITENNENSISQVPSTETDLEKAIFNTKFISYYGNGEINGADIMKMINDVVASNEANPTHLVDVQTNTLTNPSDIIDTEKYSIAIEYDANGWVNIIKVEKKN